MTDSDETSASVSRKERSSLPRIEFRKSQRRDAVFYLAAFAAAALSWLVRLLPDLLVDWVALRIGDLSFLVSKSWRANVESNLSHVLDEPPDSARVHRTARSVFQSNALNVATMLRSPHQSPRQLLDSVRVTHGDWSILDEALSAGKGVIVLTAHLGSFDSMGSSIRARGYPIAALTARTTNRFTFEFISFLRQAHDVKLIEASSSGVREAIEWVRAGKVLCLLSDRDFFVNGVQVEFFGEETTLPVGAVRIARETGAIVIPMFTVRLGSDHALMIEQPFVVERTSDRADDVTIGMQRVVAALEGAIEIAPEQWAMFQRVWPVESGLAIEPR
ncbi:MAG: lysophospholipid acyltransferase family protein [Thermomicrobiales bacterium]